MICKYQRDPNSSRHSNFMEQQYEKYYVMTVAEMDFGLYPPVHQQNIVNLKKYTSKCRNNPQHQQQIYEQLKMQAKYKVIKWYNKYHSCKQLKLAEEGNDKDKVKRKLKYNIVHIQFCPSIITMCSYLMLALTQPGDGILIFTPMFSGHISIIQASNRKAKTTSLLYEYSSENVGGTGRFIINKQEMRQKIKQVKMLFLCHPHNPSGRVWTIPEIQFIIDECKKYNVIIVSDQILSDICFTQIPFHSLVKQFHRYSKIVVLNSISKSFNYASLQAGYAFLCDQEISMKLHDTMYNVFGEQVDPLGFSVICGCLTEQGQHWLSIIKHIILSNFRKLVVFKKNRAPLLQIAELDGSYLVYINFTKYFKNENELNKALLSNKIWFVNLKTYYVPAKHEHLQMRINIACSQAHFDRFLIALNQVIRTAEVNEKFENAKL